MTQLQIVASICHAPNASYDARCEYSTHPTHVDGTNPCGTWQRVPWGEGYKQVNYLKRSSACLYKIVSDTYQYF